MRQEILGFIAGKYGIGIINLWVIFISINIIITMIPMLFNSIDNIEDLEDMIDVLAVIFVAYGVALEERDSLMSIFQLYPDKFSRIQEFIDHVCHQYGLSLLLMGLFMELAVQLVKVPNRIVNTNGIEWLIFSVASIFIMASTIMMCRLSYLILRPVVPDDERPLPLSNE